MNDRANEDPTDEPQVAENIETGEIVVNIEAHGGEGGKSEFGADGQAGKSGVEPAVDRVVVNENGVLEFQTVQYDVVISRREMTPQELTEVCETQRQQIATHQEQLKMVFHAGEQRMAKTVCERLTGYAAVIGAAPAQT